MVSDREVFSSSDTPAPLYPKHTSVFPPTRATHLQFSQTCTRSLDRLDEGAPRMRTGILEQRQAFTPTLMLNPEKFRG